MIKGRTVTVLTPAVASTDRFGEPVYGEPVVQTVDNVLIAPGATADLEASRPDGVTVALTLHFPKTFSGDLRGCSVVLTGQHAGTYRVIGEPKPFQDENTPTQWHMPVEVEVCYG